MAYFDSPKNRAIWNKELQALRAERERRAKNGFKPTEKRETMAVQNEQQKQQRALRPGSRRINLEELERIERESGGIRRVRATQKDKAAIMAARRAREREKQDQVRKQAGKSGASM